MADKKARQRKLARERLMRQQARRTHRAQRTRQATAIGVVCLVVAGLGVGGYFAFQPGGSKAAASSESTKPSATRSAATSAPATPTQAAEPARHCTYTTGSPAARKVGTPPATPDYKATYQATIRTNRGDIVIDLLNSKATCTVNSFVYLAAKKYFSNTPCHRLSTAGTTFVLQCGDPTGTGQGGPGYKFADENLKGATYSQGTVAMANSGPNTNGSQFFLVYKNSSLAPSYPPFGKVVKGLQIVQNVAKAGTDNANGTGDGHPKEKVVIDSVTIKKT
ncbi:MAG TPA: peptidylprolyl isomerase [Streptosporangiaceae bacterium]|jgi:peptidyl-prolyl cis-trans isomerase B (cyclophilin B)|nr:peptidylprolyl isomerase [Streptosporangiaceae bacterium]